jgi:phage terminase large subunit-like protein
MPVEKSTGYFSLPNELIIEADKELSLAAVCEQIRWMPMAKWDACAFPVNAKDLEGRVCFGGLDLSSTTDITAFVLLFPPEDEADKYIILPYFWVPEETLDLRVRRDHVPYDIWQKQGFIQTTEGNVVHYGYIEQFIEKLGEKYNIKEIAFDRWGAVQMTQNFEGMGFTVVPFGQGSFEISVFLWHISQTSRKYLKC